MMISNISKFDLTCCTKTTVIHHDLKNLKYVVKLKLNYKIGYFRFETKTLTFVKQKCFQFDLDSLILNNLIK